VRPGAAVLFKASRGMRLEQVAEGLSARLTPAGGARR
jgi:UDP-N-acetylmuramyl pentapeptide synthase